MHSIVRGYSDLDVLDVYAASGAVQALEVCNPNPGTQNLNTHFGELACFYCNEKSGEWEYPTL